MNAWEVYEGSDGAATKAFYDELLQRAGFLGQVAVNLFRAQKSSARAKAYRGGVRGRGSFRGMAYEKKHWSMENLCSVLADHGESLGIRYGWKRDPKQALNEWVLYVDLPNGQVSFHSPVRLAGPDYMGEWDGKHESAERIVAFCEWVRGRRYANVVAECAAGV